MKVIITKNYNELSKKAAEIMAEQINNNKESVLGLATGGSPVGLYKEIIKMNKEDKVDFSKVKTINLDEYLGLSGEHPQSYRYFMNENLFDHVNIDKNNTSVPNGLAQDIKEEEKRYDAKIEELGGTDLQLLGIGGNGHIAFNEPANELVFGTHLTDLTEETIKSNARFFDSVNDVPTKAFTMGLGGIMQAKKILVIASGQDKAEAVKGMIKGNISTMMPASMLQMHRNVVVVIDEDAAKLL